ATSVHLVCGAIGTLFVGLYSAEHSVGIQALGVVAVFAFASVTAGAVFLAVRELMEFRVSEEHEIEGLDLHEHGVAGLPDLGATVAGTHYTVVAPEPGPSFSPAAQES
ncbi:MAG: hypothetical protein R3320_09770, partial [Nitriliruptorales bacterium]|nr:hypothetical protein [Nitriliruptorales bacterium]